MSIHLAADNLIVEVTDDGVGTAVLAADGGLVGLQDRLDVLGGALSVVSLPRHGTTVLATIPLAQHELVGGVDAQRQTA